MLKRACTKFTCRYHYSARERTRTRTRTPIQPSSEDLVILPGPHGLRLPNFVHEYFTLRNFNSRGSLNLVLPSGEFLTGFLQPTSQIAVLRGGGPLARRSSAFGPVLVLPLVCSPVLPLVFTVASH